MSAAAGLLLAAVCLVTRAAPHEAPKDPLSGSPSSLLSDSVLHHETHASAPDEPGNEDERQRDASTPHAGSAAAPDTLQLAAHGTGAPGEDRGTPSGSFGGSAASDSWTGADRLRAEEDSSLPSFQEVGTEATMSSEDLPLIFEDVTPPGGSAPPSELSVAMVPAGVTVGDAELEQTVSMATERSSSDVRASGMQEWQPSGAERAGADPGQRTHTGDDITQSSVTRQTLTAVHLPASKPKTDADAESKEEPEEDEEDEEMDSEEEEEEESEEDLPESTVTPHTRPPYSLIPPPPVWVQRNQGLVRSWVELIREKAGYVSGMLAPVGIGIAGALLLVGALYSIRLIHRKRRDSFKHQRRKPPREVRSGPDNAMLLADSSEDEF